MDPVDQTTQDHHAWRVALARKDTPNGSLRRLFLSRMDIQSIVDAELHKSKYGEKVGALSGQTTLGLFLTTHT